MDIGLILTTILGSGSFFALVQFLVSRHDHKKDNLEGLKREIGLIRKTQKDTNTRVTRMELLSLIRDDPENVDAILQVAEYYFVELDGNAYAHSIFEKWATKHDVPYGWLPKITKGTNDGSVEKNNRKEVL